MTEVSRKVKILMSNERGFTLLEMLVVLTIFLLVHLAILYVFHEPIVKYTEKQVMNQNEMLIRMAQLRSIETGIPHTFQVINCNRITVREHQQLDYLYDQRLSPQIKLYLTTPSARLVFNTRGNVHAFGMLTYHIENIVYRHSINIGKGTILEKEIVHDATRSNTCGNTVSGRYIIFPHFNNNTAYL